MKYETPVLEVVGTASELIQATQGPLNDGGPYQLSMGFIAHTMLEE
jgi:hypothetical protein